MAYENYVNIKKTHVYAVRDKLEENFDIKTRNYTQPDQSEEQKKLYVEIQVLSFQNRRTQKVCSIK